MAAEFSFYLTRRPLAWLYGAIGGELAPLLSAVSRDFIAAGHHSRMGLSLTAPSLRNGSAFRNNCGITEFFGRPKPLGLPASPKTRALLGEAFAGRVAAWTPADSWHKADANNLRWTETDGPAVQEPTRKGFGRRVTEQMIAQLKGKTRYDRLNRCPLSGVKRTCACQLLSVNFHLI
jgi:hypothetical protein